jgi:transcriptional regulator with XRE-family HTH domain
MGDMETTGSRVRRLRKAKGWRSYRDADKASDVPASTWQNIESRGKIPSLRTATNIAAAFGMTVDELLSETVFGPAPPDPGDEPPDTGKAGRQPRRGGS